MIITAFKAGIKIVLGIEAYLSAHINEIDPQVGNKSSYRHIVHMQTFKTSAAKEKGGWGNFLKS